MRIKEEENSYVVKPDEAKHEGVVKIYRDNATIKLDYEKNQDFINIVKNAGYKWDGTTWGMKIINSKIQGEFKDRRIEIGNILLNSGFAVGFEKLEEAEKAIDGDFIKAPDKWVIIDTERDGDYIRMGWKTNDERMLKEALKIKYSKKINDSCVIIRLSMYNYNNILDFAQNNGFSLTKDNYYIKKAVERLKIKQHRYTPKAYIFEYFDGIKGEQEIYTDEELAMFHYEYTLEHLTDKEKAKLEYFRLFEVEATEEQIQDIKKNGYNEDNGTKWIRDIQSYKN